jgi:hypothetical protein
MLDFAVLADLDLDFSVRSPWKTDIDNARQREMEAKTKARTSVASSHTSEP